MLSFQDKINIYKKRQTELKSSLNMFSYLRVVIFLLLLIGGSYFFYDKQNMFGLMYTVAFLAVFVVVVIKYNKIHDQLAHINCYIQINQQHIDRQSNAWHSFTDKGVEYIDKKHPFSSDLDVFGYASLFQWLNTGVSYYGRTRLAQLLSNGLNGQQEATNIIELRQKAIAELADKFDFTQELQTQAMLTSQSNKSSSPALAVSQNPEGFIQAIELNANTDKLEVPVNTHFFDKFFGNYRFVFFIIPMLILLSTISLFTNYSLPLLTIFILFALQLLITTATYFNTTKVLAGFSKFQENISSYQRMLEVVESEQFNDPLLKEIQKNFYKENLGASQQLKKLERVATMVELRNSVLMYFLLSGLLLWDYHCIREYKKWCKDYGVNVRKWLEALGEFEAIASLAVVKRLKPNWMFPKIEECKSELIVTAEKIGHPLILDDERVCNDFSIKSGQAAIITGSNMSGKTTMLRTIGINLVLAYAGAPVCAKSLHCSILDIYTSMRITDDLSSGTSSFYAELLRIKQIIEFAKLEKPLLFLIDEIFRGTNSRDRIVGAKSVLKNLHKPWIIGLISTHDFELCELDNNYHFTEHYIDGIIKFDYIIREGRSQTTNARHLMEMVGIEISS